MVLKRKLAGAEAQLARAEVEQRTLQSKCAAKLARS
eukprot:COSAG06_NODE_51113_length_314_cov_0.725581_1_plen_35_part_10